MKEHKHTFVKYLIISYLMSVGGGVPVLAEQALSEKHPLESSMAIDTSPDGHAANNHYIFKGQIEVNEGINEELYTGEMKELESGKKLSMTVTSVISSAFNQIGDEFFAEITSDVEIDGALVLPVGTKAHGRITESRDPKKLGRDGYVTIEFDYLLTPDEKKLPFQAKMTTKRNPIASFIKIAATDLGYTALGGTIGSLMALKIGGIAGAVATNGYSIAGGAALGATLGATRSLTRQGKDVIIAPGDEMEVKVSADVILPALRNDVYTVNDKKLDGLAIDILEYKIEKDPFGELNTITLEVDLENRSNYTFSFFDIALLSQNKHIFYPSPFGDTSLWFKKLSPNTKVSGKISFSVDNPRQKHWLVFYDRGTRVELAKISLNGAVRTKREKLEKAS